MPLPRVRILVTGASGFVGQHVLQLLAEENAHILAVRNKTESILPDYGNVRWTSADLEQPASYEGQFRDFNPEIVIHLAWSGIPNYSRITCLNNALNSIRLFNFIADQTRCTRIIVSGSCLEYSERQGECKEGDITRARDYFAWSKTFVQEHLRLLSAEKELDFVWFRIFYVFGQGQRSGSLMPTIMSAVDNATPLNLRSPDNQNDFVYVKDVAHAFRLAVVKNSIASGIYNLGSGVPNSVREVVQAVAKARMIDLTTTTALIALGGNSECQEQSKTAFWANTEKVREVLGWVCEWNLKRAIEDFIV